MELINLEKVKDGKYLKNYELTYLNKVGKEKKYEMVSHNEIQSCDEIGSTVSGVSIVVIKGDKLLLLKEFRMSINKSIYNTFPQFRINVFILITKAIYSRYCFFQ